ncbi:cation diffusion facilitator family transporter [Paraglaciecola arctica]|uniref:cation diffusion facilitator family transporter n=1 Tax=Paraglaciecola arctica TaxID=1128911 RepID=UPI001C0775FC|nr:cation diffusion facilitator family transporter [Paraglaciecola arctica]MBU3006071.1 cation diffusion facilitator family transporter [Paraglaciecola arctica]
MHVRKILLIEGGLNAIITLCKMTVGLMTGSAAVVADAVHSLTDLVNNLFAWLAIKIAESPADGSHPYGHQKFEQLAVFALASVLTIVAFEVIVSAVERFGEPVEQSILGLAILIISLLFNIGLALWEGYWAKRLDSEILNADATHTISDVLTSVVVIIGWQLAARGYYWIDTIFALVVSSIIFYLAFKLFQRAVPVLVDQSRYPPEQLKEAVNSIPAVITVGNVRSRDTGKGQVADVTVTVSANLSTVESHHIADQIEGVLADKFDIQDVVVHVEPDVDQKLSAADS